MTTYHFDLYEAEGCSIDDEGRHFEALENALEHARQSLCFFVSQQALEGVLPLASYIAVRTGSEMLRCVTVPDAMSMEWSRSSADARAGNDAAFIASSDDIGVSRGRHDM